MATLPDPLVGLVFNLSTHLLPRSRSRLLALKGWSSLACQHTFGRGYSILRQKSFFPSKKRQQVVHKASADKPLAFWQTAQDI